MAICPNGHDSASDDFCDVCGMRITGSPAPASAGSAGSAGTGKSAGSAQQLTTPSTPGAMPSVRRRLGVRK